ncbi:MAG: ATP synthase F1 subunit delta [Candidatus Eremiobacterota bacterium]
MSDRLIARRYAGAFYSVCLEQNLINQAEQELIYFTDTLNVNEDLKKILVSPRITSVKKKEILYKIFGTAMSEVTFDFISLMVDKKRENLFFCISEIFSLVILENSNIVIAYVTTALPLGIQEQNELQTVLSARTGKIIKLDINIDPSIIGGLKVRIEDKIYDGSVTGHLKRIEEEMSGT